MPQIPVGTLPDDGTGASLYTTGRLINQWGQLNDKTVNAAFYKAAGVTTESALNLAIPAAALLGSGAAVWIPNSMLPYTPSLVTFNPLVRMLREGSRPDVYDAKAYGVALDGVTDDAARFERYIAAVPDISDCFLPAGTMLLSRGTVTSSRNNLRLQGAGQDVTTIEFQNGLVNPAQMMDFLNCTGIRIRDMSFNGNRANAGTNYTEYGAGIFFEVSAAGNYKGFAVESCHFYNLLGDGILVGTSGASPGTIERISISNCFIEDPNNPASPGGGVGGVRFGITVTSGVDVLITGNVFDGPGASGICAIRIEPNASPPASVVDAVSIIGNVIRDLQGIRIYNASQVVTNVVISGNSISTHASQSRASAIELNGLGLDSVTVTGNTITVPVCASGGAGILVDRSVGHCCISGNVVKVNGAGSHGIASAGGTDATGGWQITGNMVYGCTGNGIYLTRRFTSVMGNHLVNNGVDGVRVDLAMVDFAINCNTCISNAGFGVNINVAGCTFYTIIGNLCDNTGAAVNDASLHSLRQVFGNGGGGSLSYGGGLQPGTATFALQAGQVFQGSGVPNNANGNNGDVYFRTDTPGTANQRMYIKSAGAWVALTL